MLSEESGRYAYTALTDAAYVGLTSVMLASLVETGTRHPIVVMCLDDVTREQRALLASSGPNVELRDIERIEPPANVGIPHPAWIVSLSRLHMLGFEEFDKMVFLDSDTIVTTNIDELFSRPSLSACSHHYPIRPDRVSLNAGVVLFSPDRRLYRRIVERIIHLPSPLAPHNWSLSDQEILIALHSTEAFARAWREEHGIRLEQRWRMLDYRYNAIVGLNRLQAADWDAARAKVLHYTCGPKPWTTESRESLTDRLWWRYFDRVAERWPLEVRSGRVVVAR